jgi:hypothetical protein
MMRTKKPRAWEPEVFSVYVYHFLDIDIISIIRKGVWEAILDSKLNVRVSVGDTIAVHLPWAVAK